ncbi:MAG TPA: type II toxin-antitoxin system VapC family toxin [Hymenobacter sp.]|jgi:hypothetical protein
MRAAFLSDSDGLIDVLRQDPVAASELERLLRHGRVGVNIITRLELVVGSRDKQALHRTEQLLSSWELALLNESISEIADGLVTNYYLSHGVLIADALIAATALYHDLPFLSKNQRHFRFIPGLKLLPYPKA